MGYVVVSGTTIRGSSPRCTRRLTGDGKRMDVRHGAQECTVTSQAESSKQSHRAGDARWRVGGQPCPERNYHEYTTQ